LRNIHNPKDYASLAAAKRRLIFDEFFVFALGLSLTKRHGKAKGAPVIILCGSADEVPEAYDMGVTAVFSIQTGARPLEKALPRNGLDMRITAENIARLIGTMSST